MSETTGISRNGISITVEHLPDRKRGCLVVSEGNTSTVVAVFTSVKHEEHYLKSLIKMIGVNK